MFKKLVSLLTTIFTVLFFFKLFSKKDTFEFKYELEKEEKKKKDRGLKKEQVKKIATAVRKNLNTRQKDILKLLEKRKVLLPSDIYELHPDVSTRTLRRDMTSLVELGVVKQEGSTRDTRYILIV
jgi:predicted HTH transcriptional regulator